MNIYLIGSLRNANVPKIAVKLRALGHYVFDDWYSVGPEADEKWQEYETQRGRSYCQALAGAHAQDVFEFDKRHLDRADAVVLVLPAGKSAHLELGYARGKGKHAFILLDGEPKRFDIMYLFATKVVQSVEDLAIAISNTQFSQS